MTAPIYIPMQPPSAHRRMPPIAPHMSVAGVLVVYVLLMLLLAGTALASYFQLGAWALVVALLIAVAKTVLILLYYMHVRFASRLTWVFVGVGFVWLSILFGLTFSDYLTRMWLPRMDDIAIQTPVLPAPPGVHIKTVPTPHGPLRYQKPSDTYGN